MGQALYRKYRSKSLDEIVGQEHITGTLRQALKQGRISHAYLLTGPRGVGKTSIARILAHEINKLPYEDDSQHMDIIEIDAASNRRIDEIRELRDKIYIAPTSLKYKVYIIDEVHMLTKEAFNALLKTLEEPPEHAVFILATTDSHKLPATIVSRTQRFTFKPVETAKVAAHLAEIAKKEKIKISPEALELLAEHGQGSFRDSISLLDQLSSHGQKVEAQDVQKLLGVPSGGAIDELVGKIGQAGSANQMMVILNELFDQGFQPAGIAKQIAKRLREQIVTGNGQIPKDEALDILSRLIEVPMSHDPERFLEITLLSSLPAEEVKPENNDHENASEIKEEPQPQEQNEPQAETVKTTKPVKAVSSAKGDFNGSIWPEVLQTLKQKHNTLYGVVRMAKPTFSDDTLLLTFAFAFHEKRIKESSNSHKLSNVIFELTGHSVKVECALDPSSKPPEVSLEVPTTQTKESVAPGKDLTAISNIFGTAELLES